MSKQFDETNRGSIWGNTKKREGKQDPDFTGSLNVDGIEYWVSAWKRKEGASDKAPSLSFTVKPKEAKADHQNERPSQGTAPRRQSADMDDEIPFLAEFR